MGTTTTATSGEGATGDQRAETAEHTPGPWKVFWGKRKRHMFIGIGTETGEGITDSHFGIWRGDSAEAAANARLIAAAPDLLEAAEKARWALEWFTSNRGADPSGMGLHALNALDRALAKATLEGK